MIYFIQTGNNGPVKIGRANDPGLRLKQLQTANPNKLRLITTIKGNNDNLVHHILRGHNIRGEWFEPHNRVLSFNKKSIIQYFHIVKLSLMLLLNKQALYLTATLPGLHPLKKYCIKTGTKLKDIAARIKIDPNYLSQIIMGLRRPRPELAEQIEKATDGFVRKEELIWPK